MLIRPAVFAKMVDHTALDPRTRPADIERLCQEAELCHFKSVCVGLIFVERAKGLLAQTDVLVCTVVGFPLGSVPTELKVREAQFAVEKGAGEIDMVMNIGWAKAGLWSDVEAEIRQVVQAVPKIPVKVIIETDYLGETEKRNAAEAVAAANAAFVKTSTGFAKNGKGATVEDIVLLKGALRGRAEIKASGGIRTFEKAMALIQAGADRIGSSNSVQIYRDIPA